ncbi:LexA family transcriptional regulator [uncultured Campylobacter sp.]|uniref:XRE family transcriptional regulator n=1 Tax=uncultured Campylobacter sp. TaxID=218934 RepID=UPI00260426FC|nr:LexA family transcriptional regulator [uncultured Campylobacter sp.]
MGIGQKIRFFREERNLTQQELATLAGVSDKTIQRYEKSNDENLTTNVIKKIAKGLNLDIDALTQQGIKLGVPQPVPLSTIQFKEEVSLNTKILSPKTSNLKETETDQIFIRKLSSSVGAGESVDINGIEIYDTDVLVPFSRMLFKVCPKNTNRIRCMPVEGYSMVPMLYPDSWVIVDVTAKFEGDGLYIVNYCDHFMVKLLQKSPDGVLHIKSVNKEYDSYEIGPDSDLQVYIVGKVLRCVI